MLKRISALCIIGLVLPAGWLHAQDLLVLPGAGAANGAVQSFVTNPLTTFRTFNVGVGAFALLPNLQATKYFFVASATTNSVLTTDNTFLSPTFLANLPQPATQAIITQNGALVAVAAGNVFLFNATTNTDLFSGGITQGNGINTFALATSLDSTTIFALGSSGVGASKLTAFNTTTYGPTASLSLTQLATAVSVGPNGLVYVSLPDQILELDPRTLQPTFNGSISVSGTPGPLVFTPDGLYAAAINQAALGNSLLIASLATHTSTAPNLGLPQLTSLQVIGVDTLLALSTQALYQITLSSSPSLTPVSIPSLTAGLAALSASNDVPAGTHSNVQAVYLASENSLYQYNPATHAFATPYPIATGITPGVLKYTVPALTPTLSHAATLLTYGANQTILPSTTSEPLVVQVLDANNLPISGYSVQFQASNTAALSTTTAITGANGYALTYVTASPATGAVTVTATAGSLQATFPIEVSTTAQQGGGPVLTIIDGQGQLMFAETSTLAGPSYGQPLQVLATDAGGTPIVNLPINFSIPASDGTLIASDNFRGPSVVVNTNADGVASVDFLTTMLPSNDNQGFLQSLITASAANTNVVTFYITAVNTSPSTSVYVLAPTNGVTLTGPEGSTLPGAVEVEVISPDGVPIPNVSLTITDDADTPLSPTATCNAPGGLVLTSPTGIAACGVTFGPRLGAGTFIANTGYTHPTTPIPFVVTAGAPNAVQITQGNNQTGSPGQTLPLALRVHVTDSGGNTVVGGAINWQVLTAGAVTLSNIINKTDSNGNASALATLGSIAGVAQVQATAGTASATFSLTVNIPSVGIQKVSGDLQTTTVGAAYPLPLVVKVVDSGGNGVPGAQVNFEVTSGAATLGSTLVVTDSTGQASTSVTAGTTPGATTISAISGAFNVSFTLTAQPIGPNNITIVNGASFSPNTGISPGGIATIRGMGILPGVQGLLSAANSAGQLPTTFSGVTITFNGTPAPIYYVEDTNGADQVSVQVPFEVQPGPDVAMMVAVANVGSATVMVPVKPLAPGVFTSIYGGKTYAVAVRPDGSQVSPTNPAQRGENLQFYVTGLGQATPTIATGAPGVPDQTIVSSLVVGLDNGGVRLIDSVYGPGLIGIYVVTIQVPANAETGPYQPVGIIAVDSTGNLNYAQATYIPIE